MKVPFLDLTRSNLQLKKQFAECIDQTFTHSSFILGPEVEQFERNFCKYLNSPFGVGVSTGTAALKLALQVLDLKAGDEVLVPANTFIGSIIGAIELGLKIIPVDINQQTLEVDLSDAKNKLNSRTKVFIWVHLFGRIINPQNVINFCQHHGLSLIEDACQAHGASWQGKMAGTLGDLGCFSFYPTKNLGGIGDGGFVTTKNEKYYWNIKKLRNYGSLNRCGNEIMGGNHRLDSIQASFLNLKLEKLDQLNAQRVKAANIYFKLLKDIVEIDLLNQINSLDHVFHLFVIKTKKRNQLKQFLQDADIFTQIHYENSINDWPSTKDHPQVASTPCINAEAASKKILSLPFFPGILEEEIQFVCTKIKLFFNNYDKEEHIGANESDQLNYSSPLL